jgi:tryptophan 2-monooxygenase
MIFNGANPPGGKRWAYPEDYERFASLGAGFGGFGPLYQVEFPEIIRLVVNGLESDQMLVPGGIEQVADKLTNSSI